MKKHVAKHGWYTLKVALFWGAITGGYAALPAFQELLSPYIYGALCVSVSMALVGARILKRPGAE